MMVLVSYDVSTREEGGPRRLRRVARACQDYGQRVQYSIFEIEVEPAQWTALKQKLLDLVDLKQDSLRFYYLGKHWQSRVEHVGTKTAVDFHGPLVF